ncbi:hypothetical protein [Halorubrum lipolyticum]|uniref:Uncharacterized protein n=1 Tax=Halorubrum lipolyticum DSM 21995 TaxID=1227482 RepID=M0NJT8_9EURY|nr:hypothetical protein [Halorubrum lipolyticum]EMA57818.1 hypothetical protein C469_14441 [Halorubrum lipolyticum DSM 21995]
MSGDTDPFVEPAERTRYDLLRSKHVIVPLSLQRKLRLCGLIALLAALGGPIAATLPGPVRETYFAGDPTTTRLGAAAAVLVGTAALTAAVVGLTAVALYLDRHPDPPDSAVWTLIAAEDAASGFGFVTGTLGVVCGGTLLASGHWGTAAVQRLIGLGIQPYLVYEQIPATPRIAAVAGLVVGLGALASSVYVGSQ